MYSYEMTADDLPASARELAILPVGSIEQHGAHLPIGTDWYIAGAIGQGLADRTGGLLLPTLPVSTCREHMGKPGSVWMNPDTFYSMLTDILMSLREQGFQRAAVIPGHGGIFTLPAAIRQVNATCNPGFRVAIADPSARHAAMKAEGLVECDDDIHAGEWETALMLHIAPHTVRMELARDFVPDVPRPYLHYGSIFCASPTGVWGCPTKATAEKGRRLLERCIDVAAEEMDKAFAYMANKKPIGYSGF